MARLAGSAGYVDLSVMTTALPEAVLFDMDGTLIDSEMYWIASEKSLVEEFGGVWTTAHGEQLVGNSLDKSAQILREAGVNLPADVIIDRLSHAVKEQVAVSLPWRPGAAELICALRDVDVPLALVTMSYSLNALDFARRAEELLGISVFSAIVSGDDVERGKPDPEPYLRAAAALGVTPSRCVAIEDSWPGVRSALASGAATVGVPLYHDLSAIPGVTVWDSLVDKNPADVGRVSANHRGKVA